jgi:hypothetical protein
MQCREQGENRSYEQCSCEQKVNTQRRKRRISGRPNASKMDKIREWRSLAVDYKT